MAIGIDGKVINAYQDRCTNYKPDKDNPLGIESVKQGMLYECKKYELPKFETGTGCFWCINQHIKIIIPLRPEAAYNTTEAAALESTNYPARPDGAKELLRKYNSCIKGFEEEGTTTLLEEMIDNVLKDARGKAIAEQSIENLRLRKILWLGHRCHGSLYGDDGEMQCNTGDHKPIDFKRDSVADIWTKMFDTKGQTLYDMKIPVDEQDNVLAVLWSMIGEVEMKITAKSVMEKHVVSQAYNLLNRIDYTKDRPRFETNKDTGPQVATSTLPDGLVKDGG